jgi:uncharacterized NAD(P)/FAD-binding protein YdhS
MVLIGGQTQAALGVAYDTPYQANLLNVPAGNMSAFPNDMNHFTRWLAKHLPGSSAATFAPRKLYGEYLQSIFTKLRKESNKVNYLNTKVIELKRQDDLWFIRLENGNVVKARWVVLALGNLLLPDHPIDFHSVSSYYHRNPWSSDVTKDLPIDASVLLIGTGLTMVDVALSLREAGHRGVIHAISRHGRLYQSHKPYQPRPLKNIPEDFNSPLGALLWIRKEIKNAEQTGNNWRAVIDSLRPHISSIWQRWDLRQRKSFLRHTRNFWDTHRHRMAPEIADQLSVLFEERTLVIHRGSLISAQVKDDKAAVLWKDKDTNEAKILDVARIINCTGPSRNIARVQSPLVSKLLSSGWITPDPLQLGLETDPEGRLLDKSGNISHGLYTLGPLRIAGLWESIAIPEIRNQALALAELLVAETIEAGVPA